MVLGLEGMGSIASHLDAAVGGGCWLSADGLDGACAREVVSPAENKSGCHEADRWR